MDTSALKINTRSKRMGMPSKAACVLIEYLPRGTLKSYLIKNRGRKLAFKTVVRLALDLARGYVGFLFQISFFFIRCSNLITLIDHH